MGSNLEHEIFNSSSSSSHHVAQRMVFIVDSSMCGFFGTVRADYLRQKGRDLLSVIQVSTMHIVPMSLRPVAEHRECRFREVTHHLRFVVSPLPEAAMCCVAELAITEECADRKSVV